MPRATARPRAAPDRLARAPPGLVSGRTVLVLDDILDHGETMARSASGCSSSARSEFYCAVLVEKTLGMKKPITADFVGLHDPRPFRLRLRHGREGLLAQPARDPRHEGMTMALLAIIGGSGLSQLGNLEATQREVVAHALRRALRRAHLRPHRRPRRGVPRAARLRPHHRAARGELPRQHLGAQGRRRRLRGVGGLGRRHPLRHRARDARAPRTRSSTTPGGARRPTSRARACR